MASRGSNVKGVKRNYISLKRRESEAVESEDEENIEVKKKLV